jgi:hypothetical protein
MNSVMEAQAVMGGMSGLGAAAPIREGEAAEGSVGKVDALARHEGSIAIGKDTEKDLEEQKMFIEPGAFEWHARRGIQDPPSKPEDGAPGSFSGIQDFDPHFQR